MILGKKRVITKGQQPQKGGHRCSNLRIHRRRHRLGSRLAIGGQGRALRRKFQTEVPGSYGSITLKRY